MTMIDSKALTPMVYVLLVSEVEHLAERGEEIPDMTDDRFKEVAKYYGEVLTLAEFQSRYNNEDLTPYDSYIRIQ